MAITIRCPCLRCSCRKLHSLHGAGAPASEIIHPSAKSPLVCVCAMLPFIALFSHPAATTTPLDLASCTSYERFDCSPWSLMLALATGRRITERTCIKLVIYIHLSSASNNTLLQLKRLLLNLINTFILECCSTTVLLSVPV